ncbi:MAG: sigma-70 family RNA polymerase sigma factor [Pirellulaceae bacterium]|nr:sigma-70 family RNA polymerase sigma factor [Planctomycetales bacterium]
MNNEEFERVFSGHRQRLRAMLGLRMDPRLRERIDISDILQEAYLEAHRRRGEYDANQMPPYLWLRMIAGQKLVDVHRHHLQAKKRTMLREVRMMERGMPEASSIDLAAELADSMTSVTKAVIRAEVRLKVEEALSQLQAIDREVLALRHFEQLTNAEVAQVLNLSPTAASNRYVRAIKKLRDALPSDISGEAI